MRKRSSSARSTARRSATAPRRRSTRGSGPARTSSRSRPCTLGLDWLGQPLDFDPEPVTLHLDGRRQRGAEHDPRLRRRPRRRTSTHRLLRRQLGRPDRALRVRRSTASSAECEPGVAAEVTDLLLGPHTFTARAIDLVRQHRPDARSRSRGRSSRPPARRTRRSARTSSSRSTSPAARERDASFFEVTTAGHTTLEPLGGGPPLPEGYTQGGMQTFDFKTTAEFGEPVDPLPELRPDAFATPAGPPALLRGRPLARHHDDHEPVHGQVCGLIEDFGLYALAAASVGLGAEHVDPLRPRPARPRGHPGLEPDDRDLRVLGRPARRARCSARSTASRSSSASRRSRTRTSSRATTSSWCRRSTRSGCLDLTPAIYEWEIVARPGHDAARHDHHGRPGQRLLLGQLHHDLRVHRPDDQTPPLELDFECFLDGADLGGCDTLEEIEVETAGEHTFGVRAVDDAGNIDPDARPSAPGRSSTCRRRTRRSSAGPTARSTETTATFTFEGFEELTDLPVDEFECALDNAGLRRRARRRTRSRPRRRPARPAGARQGSRRATSTSPRTSGSGSSSARPTRPRPTRSSPSARRTTTPAPTSSSASSRTSRSRSTSAASTAALDGPWEPCEPVLRAARPRVRHAQAVGPRDRPRRSAERRPDPGRPVHVGHDRRARHDHHATARPTRTGAFSATFDVHEPPGRRDLPLLGRRHAVRCPAPRRSSPARSSRRASTTSRSRAVNQFRNIDGEQVMDQTPADVRVDDRGRRRARHVDRLDDGARPDRPRRAEQRPLRVHRRRQPDRPGSSSSSSARSTTARRGRAASRSTTSSRKTSRAASYTAPGPRGRRASATSIRPRADERTSSSSRPTRSIDDHRRHAARACSRPRRRTRPTVELHLHVRQPERDLRVLARRGRDRSSPAPRASTYTRPVRRARSSRVQAVAELGTRSLEPAVFDVGERHARSAGGDAPERADRAPTAAPRSRTTATFTFEAEPDRAERAASSARSTTSPPTFCASPTTYTGLQPGVEHTFEVLATEQFELLSSDAALVDLDDRGRRGAGHEARQPAAAQPEPENVTFHFSGVDNGTPTIDLDFQCSLDGAARDPETIAAPRRSTLQNLTGGQHTFTVAAIDSGTLGASSSPTCRRRSYTWHVIAPPLTVITGPVEPGGTSTSADATLSFFDQPGSTYVCRLDPVDEPVETPLSRAPRRSSSPDLTNGTHGLRGARDDAVRRPSRWSRPSTCGRSPCPTRRRPSTTIDLGPANGSSARTRSRRFIFSGTDGLTAGARAHVRVPPRQRRRDRRLGGLRPGYQIVDLAVGAHTFEVRAIDQAGNVDAHAGEPLVDARAGPEQHAAAGAPVELALPIQGGGTATITFAEVTGAGLTTRHRARRGAPTLPAGYLAAGARLLRRLHDGHLRRRRHHLPPVRPGSLDEPRLLHFDGSAWLQITTSIDQANGIVCGLTDGLSPFAIAQPIPSSAPTTEIARGAARPSRRDRARLAEVTFHSARTTRSPSSSARSTAADVELVRQPVRVRRPRSATHTLLARAKSAERRDRPDAGRPVHLHGPGAADRDGPLRSRRPGAGASPASRTRAGARPSRSASDQPGSTFECRLTERGRPASTWEPCTSPWTYNGLALDEEYTFEVQAYNAAGHVSLLPAEFEWEVADLTAPVTTHRRPARRPDVGDDRDVHLLGERARDLRVLARRRGSATCPSSGSRYTGLDLGAHTFHVRATDLSEYENLELEPSVYTWTVDADGAGRERSRARSRASDDPRHVHRLPTTTRSRRRSTSSAGSTAAASYARLREPEDRTPNLAAGPAHLRGPRDRRGRQHDGSRRATPGRSLDTTAPETTFTGAAAGVDDGTRTRPSPSRAATTSTGPRA